MDVKIDLDELRKRKVFVATPMYGGQCFGTYTKSSIELAKLAMHYGLDYEFSFIFNESLITRARNYLVDTFLRSNYTHMMFIDSDVGYDPNDVITLAAIAEPGSDKQIITGAYPKKSISWEKIKKAVDMGIADDDPNVLEKYVGDYVFNPKAGTDRIPINEPVKVLEGGTGFMMIQREALEKYAEAYSDYSYLPDHVRTQHFDGSREITAFFDTIIDPDTKRYLSEDYMFCQYAQKIGIDVWLCPWMKLQHTGTYTFGGSLADIASIGASATVDEDIIKKKKGKK